MKHLNDGDKIIKSLDDSRRALPSEDFLLRMENLAVRYTSVIENVSFRAIIGIAASFTILLIVNIMILNKSQNTNIGDTTTKTTSASSTYDLIPTKSLYNE